VVQISRNVKNEVINSAKCEAKTFEFNGKKRDDNEREQRPFWGFMNNYKSCGEIFLKCGDLCG